MFIEYLKKVRLAQIIPGFFVFFFFVSGFSLIIHSKAERNEAQVVMPRSHN